MVAWARSRSQEWSNSKLGWQLGPCKALAMCSLPTWLARHIGKSRKTHRRKLESWNVGSEYLKTGWGSSAEVARIKSPIRVGCGEGLRRGLCSLPRNVLGSLILKWCILVDSGWYKLKLDTWFTTSHHRRMASFSACLVQKIRLWCALIHFMSWSVGLLSAW
jgi:hypothetical protein